MKKALAVLDCILYTPLVVLLLLLVAASRSSEAS
jgi:hypothetical protein